MTVERNNGHTQAPLPAAGEVEVVGRRLAPAIVAIDGPAASGKSTIGRLLAKRLGYLFFDTGVMYRAVTWAALDRSLDVHDGAKMGELAESIEIDIVPSSGETGEAGSTSKVFVDNRDATSHIRSADVDRAVSAVSAHSRVRSALSRQQRRVAADYGDGSRDRAGIVMVGRDIGSVVVPDARVKVYLDATAQERARRRHCELIAVGTDVAYEDVLADVLRRDAIDSRRKIAPLAVAADATVLDTTDLTPDEVIGLLIELVRTTEQSD